MILMFKNSPSDITGHSNVKSSCFAGHNINMKYSHDEIVAFLPDSGKWNCFYVTDFSTSAYASARNDSVWLMPPLEMTVFWKYF